MKDFSAREMRREYRGVFRLLMSVFTALMLCCAVLGAILAAKGASENVLLIATGLMVALALCVLGLYLIISDPKRLLQKTPYGQALARLGDPVKMMDEIDRDAEKRCEPYGNFTLLNRWLILYLPDGWRFEPKRPCARPLKRESIRVVHVLPPENPYDPQEFRVSLLCGSEQYEFPCFQRQDLDALRAWIGETEEEK